MSLREKLLVLVLSLVTTAIITVSLILGWSAQKSTAQQTEKDGLLLAKMIARRAGTTDRLPQDLEETIGEQMLQQAHFIASMVALGQNGRPQLQTQLTALSKSKGIVGISWLDGQGRVIMQTTTMPGWEIGKFSSELKDVISGKLKELISSGQNNEKNEHILKLAAVPTLHQPGAICILYDLSNSRWKKEVRGTGALA